MRKLDRRQFTQEAGLAFLAGVSVVVSGCGGGGYDPPTGNSGSGSGSGSSNTGDKEGTVAANHGHVAMITAAQLQAGGAVQIDIAGQAGHPHIVDLPAQAVEEIRAGRAVQKQSTSTDAHSHLVTFNSEASGDPSRY
jgi:hypothetical protein